MDEVVTVVLGDVNYVLVFAPLALGHLIIPPLSYVSRKEIPLGEFQVVCDALYSLLPVSLLDMKNYLTLLLNETSRKTLSWASVTHLFVHSDYNHLFGNLSSAFIYGQRVHRQFGTLYFYTLFFTGGVVSSLSQGEESLVNALKRIDSPIANKNNGSTSEDLLGSLFDSVSSLAKPAVALAKQVATSVGLDLQTYYCGSSGAVCALMGCDFVLRCQHLTSLYEMWSHKLSYLNGQTTSSVTVDRSGKIRSVAKASNTLSLAMLSIETALSLWNWSMTLRYVYSEISALKDEGISSQQSSSWNSWMSWMLPRNRIHHAAHVQGFLFGSLVGMGSLLWSAHAQR